MLRQKYSILHQISELSRRLKEVNSVKSDEFICAEFSVEKDLVGHSIGAGGANIRRARSVDGIVSVILNPDTCTFKVTGKTKEAVENAKKLLEYATEAMQVPQQYVGRIVGQKNHQIQALVDRVGLARIRVQAANEVTVPNCVPFAFTGTRSAINDAKILINFITDNLREIDQLQAKITPHEYNHFNNGENSRYKRRDPSSKSESAKGERNFRFHQMDNGQATDNGLTTATTFNGDAGGRFRGGRVTDMGTEHSDSASFRNSRPSNNRRRKNQLQPSRGGGGGGKPSSPPRQKSLPPPAPRTEESIQQYENIPRPGSRHHDGGRRGKGGNRNQNPLADIEGVSAITES
ncbi:Synaptic functional regulator FMR1 [Taenia crassiceps]|uniref:Synaptic functional regulator FMR1 n=1 Tax=Taenia crassiceps TaxID=6207 RepID=A0ABR4QPK7_9CEST